MRSVQPATLTYRPDIDGLRAVAVLLVVAFHAFPRLVPGGFVGVDVFFVISGFLISSVILQALKRDSFSYLTFYERRIRRIFPALTVVLLGCLFLAWFASTPEEYAQLGKHAAAGALFVSNLLLWAEAGYFDAEAQTKPLLHLWSLGIEEQFYIFWPLLLVRLRRSPLAVAGIITLSFAVNVVLTDTRPTAAFYSPIPRFWELLMGALLAQLDNLEDGTPRIVTRLVHKLQILPHHRLKADLISVVGLVLILAAAVGLDDQASFPGWLAILPVTGAAAIIGAGPCALVNRLLLSRRSMIVVGLVSYPLYLWHWPILVFLRESNLATLPATNRLVRLGAVAVSVGLAYLTYRGIELPVRRSAHAVKALCTTLSMALATSIVVVLTRGASGRLSDAQLRVMEIAESNRLSAGGDWREGSCFLKREQDERDFGPECVDNAREPDRSVLLWGDSHAAHLYSGLKSVLPGRGLHLAQLTASSCPPLVSYASKELPHCESINKYVLDWVRKNRPHTVVLAANWPRYPGYPGIEWTIARLGAAGVKTVAVIGPVAVFRRPQPTLVIRKSSGGRIPARVANLDLQELWPIDAALREISRRTGAEYVSPLTRTCNADGCLVALHGQPDLLLAFDNAHLTKAGSAYIVSDVLCAASSVCGTASARLEFTQPRGKALHP